MAQRDYKNSKTAPAKKSAGGTLLGVVIGLLLGLMIAVAVAFYLNKGPKPFADRTGAAAKTAAGKGAAPGVNEDPNRPLYGKDAKGAKGGADDAAKKDEKRFSFYEILPGKEEVIDARKAQELAKAPDAKAADKSAADKGAAKADDGKAPSKEQYFLQAGAFASAGDADNQKAKLALLGFEAKVETVDIEGKGTMHRVRIGPYGRLDDINRVRSTLATNGVDAALIKLKDAQK